MLAKDRSLAAEHDLELRCEQGSLTDLSRFADASFDIVFLPVSVCYVPDVDLIWKESARVLRPNGRLLAGMINPLVGMVFVWSHTLIDLIGGQLSAGFRLLDFAEARSLIPVLPASTIIQIRI